MKFILTLHDREGTPLNEGDIVKVSNGSRGIQFFAEVKYLENEQAIAPFHTFSFHSFVKVDKVPDDAIISPIGRYKVWYIDTPQDDENHEAAEKYLSDWRQCETLLEQKVYRIEKHP